MMVPVSMGFFGGHVESVANGQGVLYGMMATVFLAWL
jgi:hypothetical protein